MSFNNECGFDTSFYESQHPLVKHSLTKISSDEIQDMMSRINLYLEHFKIISMKKRCSTSENKASILKKIKTLLYDEIESRQAVPVAISSNNN